MVFWAFRLARDRRLRGVNLPGTAPSLPGKVHGAECTATAAAKICDFFPVAAVALPQLSTIRPGVRVEMTKVSPGQTDESPNAFEIRTGADSQPRVMEKARRYWA